MEWRQQASVSCEDAFREAKRWIEEVTGKSFGCNDFRAALENGVLLCDLINQLKPGIIKRVNRLSTPIAGLDNVNVFLKACEKVGLNDSQLFHPGDLQDLSTRVTLRRDEGNRRLKNVLITIYWLGRKAQLDTCYRGPQLNFKAFEGLLGLTLSKALDEGNNGLVKDGGYRVCQNPEEEEEGYQQKSCRRENSADILESLDSQALRLNVEGCGSDAEAEEVFKMENMQPSSHQNKGHIPSPLRRKQEREESGRGCASSLSSTVDAPPSPQSHLMVSSPESATEELFFQALCEEDLEDDYTDADPVLDDLYFRRVQQTLHQTSTNYHSDRFLPQYWTPEEEIRVRRIYLGSQRRPWYHKMQSLRASQIQVKPEKPVQVNPGWIWSKSLSDIPMVYPVRKAPDGNAVYDGQDTAMSREWNQESIKKCDVATKDSDAQWQDDLTKWKNRRRSTKSDLRTCSQDREHVINKMTNGAATSFMKNEAQLKYQQSPQSKNIAPRPYTTSSSSKSSSDLRSHTRALLAHSYATEVNFNPTGPLSSNNSTQAQGPSSGAVPRSDRNILGEEIHFASSASDGAGGVTPSFDFPIISQTQDKSQSSIVPLESMSELAQPKNGFTNQISTPVTTIQLNETAQSKSDKNPALSTSSEKKPILYVTSEVKTAGEGMSRQSHSSQEDGQKSSWEPVVEQGRAHQSPAVYKYLPRTGSWSSSASLPRGYRRSEGSRLSTAITAKPFGAKQSRISSLPRLFNVDDNQGLLLNSEKEDSLCSPTDSPLKRQTATAQLRGQYQVSVREKKANQEKEVNSANLCSQASSQTNGYAYQSSIQTHILPQPYSNQQSRQNKGLTLSSNESTDLPKMDHSDMRVSLTLKPNSIADFGFHTHWDSTGARVKFIQSGSPAELCQLRVNDEIVAVDGVAVAHMNYDQWEDKMASALQTGNLTMDIRRYGNKDWSTSEGSHQSQPGQSRVTLNLTASPVLIGCPDHHANSAAFKEMAGTQVFKINGHTDNVMQGKIIGGELSDKHGTARSKGGSESAISDLQVPSLSPSSSSWSWDHEEDRRRQEKWQEEQERLLQEQYQRDQERLKAEWQKAQQEAGDVKSGKQNTFEITTGAESLARTQQHVSGLSKKTREDQSPDREKLKEAGPKLRSNAKGVQNDKIAEQDWTKSLSSPVLTGHHKHSRGDQTKRQGLFTSKAEQERQRILDEMKKRTQLLTDNSWIRQRSSSFYRDPTNVGVPMKRYESLDNLDNLRQPRASTTSYPRPHSAAAGYFTPTRNASSRYSTGSILSQRNPYMESSHHARMVSGRRTCCVCWRVLGSRAAMVIEALSLWFHLACFQCVGCHRHLGGTETGVQVRIRNRKPYCERCYFQLKSFHAPYTSFSLFM